MRVTANFNDQSQLSSEPTNWLKINNIETDNFNQEVKNNFKNERDLAPLPPFVNFLKIFK